MSSFAGDTQHVYRDQLCLCFAQSLSAAEIGSALLERGSRGARNLLKIINTVALAQEMSISIQEHVEEPLSDSREPANPTSFISSAVFPGFRRC